MEELQILKRKIEEKFASSDTKRITPELVLICIERLDSISKRLDEIESKISNGTSESIIEKNLGYLKEFKGN